MKTAGATGPPGSTLLAAFSADVRQQLAAEEKQYQSHALLIEADETPEWLYFPHRGAVISLTRSSESGATVEVGIVGAEGVVSAHALLAPTATGADAVVQISGAASRVLCNRLHSIEQRLSKWLLGVHDRVGSDELGLTHDFLSHMLGIRRSGVTLPRRYRPSSSPLRGGARAFCRVARCETRRHGGG